MEGEGPAMSKTEPQAPNEDCTNTTTGNICISSVEKVFYTKELVEKILGYLSPKEQLNCRGINRVWRSEVGRWLEKRSKFDLALRKFEDDFRTKEFPFMPSYMQRVNFLSRFQFATRFRNTGDIGAFLNHMGDLDGSPFPSKTVIFCVDECIDSQLPRNVMATLTEFVSRFGDEILNCFVVFNDETADVIQVNDFLVQLSRLKNLKFLSLSRTYWYIDNEPSLNLSCLEKLKQVQICGDGAYDILKLFISSGSFKQIEILHVHGTGKLYFYKHIGTDPLPNLKKLVVTSGSYLYSGESVGGKLEELSVSQDGMNLRLYQALHPLLHADRAHWETLRRISIRTDQYVGKVLEAGTVGLVDFVDSAKIQYPNMKEVGISHLLLEKYPCLLGLFAAKFPNWEKIHLYNHPAIPADPWGENEEENKCRARYDCFAEICTELWNLLPDSVTTITAEWEWAEKKATRTLSD